MMHKEAKLEKKKHSVRETVSLNFYMLKKIMRHSPMLIITILLLGIVSGVCSSIHLIFVAQIFRLLGQGAELSEFIFPFILGLAGVTLNLGFNRLNVLYITPWMQNRLHYRMHEEIFNKSLQADLYCFDDPDFYNDFVWAMDESDTRASAVLSNISNIISFFISFSTVLTIIMTISPVVVIISILRSIGNFFLYKYYNTVSLRRNEQTKILYRMTSYINRVFNLPDYAKELRTSDIGSSMMDTYDKTTDKILETNLFFNKKNILANFLMLLLDYAVPGVLVIYMTICLYNGSADFSGFVIAISYMWTLMYSLQNFGYYFTVLEMNSDSIHKNLKFQNFAPKDATRTRHVPDFETIALKNVSFSYGNDGNSPATLKNLNLTIKKGEKIAVVGYNGAGKTTLTKLIMRFYDPSDGEILYNGINIKEFDLNEYRGRIGAVFQDFKLFSASVAENILGHEVRSEEDRETVFEAIKKASFENRVAGLKSGIDTVLTREYDDEGTNLSGGEGQKVAIARVFVKPYDIVIMDEPSSALDPVAEYDLNHSVAENLKKQTVIFISHRLSTTKMTDRIYMFDSGSIIESGSHSALMEKGGKYAEMFIMQAKKYAFSKIDFKQ